MSTRYSLRERKRALNYDETKVYRDSDETGDSGDDTPRQKGRGETLSRDNNGGDTTDISSLPAIEAKDSEPQVKTVEGEAARKGPAGAGSMVAFASRKSNGLPNANHTVPTLRHPVGNGLGSWRPGAIGSCKQESNFWESNLLTKDTTQLLNRPAAGVMKEGPAMPRATGSGLGGSPANDVPAQQNDSLSQSGAIDKSGNNPGGWDSGQLVSSALGSSSKDIAGEAQAKDDNHKGSEQSPAVEAQEREPAVPSHPGSSISPGVHFPEQQMVNTATHATSHSTNGLPIDPRVDSIVAPPGGPLSASFNSGLLPFRLDTSVPLASQKTTPGFFDRNLSSHILGLPTVQKNQAMADGNDNASGDAQWNQPNYFGDNNIGMQSALGNAALNAAQGSGNSNALSFVAEYGEDQNTNRDDFRKQQVGFDNNPRDNMNPNALQNFNFGSAVDANDPNVDPAAGNQDLVHLFLNFNEQAGPFAPMEHGGNGHGDHDHHHMHPVHPSMGHGNSGNGQHHDNQHIMHPAHPPMDHRHSGNGHPHHDNEHKMLPIHPPMDHNCAGAGNGNGHHDDQHPVHPVHPWFTGKSEVNYDDPALPRLPTTADKPYTPPQLPQLPRFRAERVHRVFLAPRRFLPIIGLLYPDADFIVARHPASQHVALRMVGRAMARAAALDLCLHDADDAGNNNLNNCNKEEQEEALFAICLWRRDWPSGGAARIKNTEEDKQKLNAVLGTFGSLPRQGGEEVEVWNYWRDGEHHLRVVRGYRARGVDGQRYDDRTLALWAASKKGLVLEDKLGKEILAFMCEPPQHEENQGGPRARGAKRKTKRGRQAGEEDEEAEEQDEE
jgi:hypothetical protein